MRIVGILKTNSISKTNHTRSSSVRGGSDGGGRGSGAGADCWQRHGWIPCVSGRAWIKSRCFGCSRLLERGLCQRTHLWRSASFASRPTTTTSESCVWGAGAAPECTLRDATLHAVVVVGHIVDHLGKLIIGGLMGRSRCGKLCGERDHIASTCALRTHASAEGNNAQLKAGGCSCARRARA